MPKMSIAELRRQRPSLDSARDNPPAKEGRRLTTAHVRAGCRYIEDTPEWRAEEDARYAAAKERERVAAEAAKAAAGGGAPQEPTVNTPPEPAPGVVVDVSTDAPPVGGATKPRAPKPPKA